MKVINLFNKYTNTEIIKRYLEIYKDEVSDDLNDVLDRIRSIKIPDDQSQYVIVPYMIQYIDYDNLKTEYVNPSLYKKRDLNRFAFSGKIYKKTLDMISTETSLFIKHIRRVQSIKNKYSISFFNHPIKLPVQYSIDCDEWENILNYDVLSILGINKLDLLCSILFEMTFFGCTEEIIKNKVDSISDILKDALEHPESLRKIDSSFFHDDDYEPIENKRKYVIEKYRLSVVNIVSQLKSLFFSKQIMNRRCMMCENV